jgi:hypothetical protein
MNDLPPDRSPEFPRQLRCQVRLFDEAFRNISQFKERALAAHHKASCIIISQKALSKDI